ncbi:MAG: BofC C-terminal domain-containing protein [Bacillota bacterium]
MYRRRRSKKKWVIGCLLLLVLSFGYGYWKGDVLSPNKPNVTEPNPLSSMTEVLQEKQPNKNTNTNTNEQQNSQSEDPIISPTPEIENDHIITNGTKLLLTTYYEKTRDTITNEGELPAEIYELTLVEIQQLLMTQYPDWTIRELSGDVIELYRVKNGVSPNHYIAKANNNFISFYKVDEHGKEILYEQTEIPLDVLSETDKSKLKEGIILNSLNDLDRIKEDYGS